MKNRIREYIERKEAREAFKQEALASWGNYQENDLHLTGTEAGNWLDTWGTQDESEQPSCHG